MELIDVIRRLQANPRQFLESVTPIYLDALLHGYGAIDARVFRVMQAINLPIGPTASLGVCPRMYLAESDTERGVAILLGKLEESLSGSSLERSDVQGSAHRPLASVVGEIVKQQRPALLFGEPTVSWVFHFSIGYNFAFEEVDREAADADRKQLDEFGEWLRRYYGWDIAVPWHRLIRVYEGEHFDGLVSFVRLWNEFVTSVAKTAVE